MERKAARRRLVDRWPRSFRWRSGGCPAATSGARYAARCRVALEGVGSVQRCSGAAKTTMTSGDVRLGRCARETARLRWRHDDGTRRRVGGGNAGGGGSWLRLRGTGEGGGRQAWRVTARAQARTPRGGGGLDPGRIGMFFFEIFSCAKINPEISR
jgi:hypothetical protein